MFWFYCTPLYTYIYTLMVEVYQYFIQLLPTNGYLQLPTKETVKKTIAFLPLSNLTKSEVFCKLGYGISPK